MYRKGGFCLDPLLERPADYFGWMLSELKGRGTDPRGFYPTPMSVTQMMASMLFSGGDHRAQTVSDPCVGTGRMLLAASNWSLRLYGQDIDARCVTATLVNGALYAPWLSFPFPESFWKTAAPHLPVEPLGVAVFDQEGQGLLFPGAAPEITEAKGAR